MLKTRQSLIEYRYEYVDMNCFSSVPNIHGHLPLSCWPQPLDSSGHSPDKFN